MLLTRAVLDEIVAGRVELQFRRWKRPTVKRGGRLRTQVGELAIGAVDVVEPAAISDEEARRAGWPDAASLVAELFRERTGSGRGRTAQPDETSVVYRVEVAYAGEDARIARRATLLTASELTEVLERLRRIDERAAIGAWTQRVLALVEQWPARRAPELAELEGRETMPFKADVRKLKELGLTESLPVGYRLSPRGEQVLAALRRNP